MRYAFGSHRLDPALRELRQDGAVVPVEPQVFDLILHLVRNRDRVVSQDELIETLWQGRIISDSTFRSRINAARRALGDNGRHQHLIRTLPRRGFRFVADVAEEREPTPAADGGGRDAEPEASVGPAGAAPERDGRPTVVILPFGNLSGDPRWEHYADGITEDITTALAKHRSLLVVARNSAFAFKGRGSDVRRVGRELGADYVVEGSLHKLPRRLRVTARLVESATGHTMWADRFDTEPEAIFDVQDTITAMIAANVEPQIGTAERQRVEKVGSRRFPAWDLFHLGTKHLYRATLRDNREAQRLLRDAIEEDPGLAQGHALLSYAILLSMLYFDAEPEEARLEEAQALAAIGLELDDQDALIRFVYGRALLTRRDYAGALEELRSAVEMNPTLALAHCGVGDSLAYEGRFEEAFPYFDQAIDLSRYDPQRWAFQAYRALAHLLAGQIDLAADWARKATRVPHCHYWPLSHRVAALGHLRCPEETDAAVAALLRRKPDFSREFARKRLFYLKNEEHLDTYLDGLRRAGVRA